ncbi:MAG: diguanylate cyclase [Candidatus Thiodiazotropha sp.]
MKPNHSVNVWVKEALGYNLIGAIYIDIDNLAWHNDSFGHAIGDETIEKISKIVSSISQQSNSNFSRVGGDKFIVIPDAKSVENTFEIADQIHYAINDLMIVLVNKNTINPQSKFLPDYVTVSIGAFIRTNKNPPNEEWFLRMASISCEFAKFGGKNRVVKIDLR